MSFWGKKLRGLVSWSFPRIIFPWCIFVNYASFNGWFIVLHFWGKCKVIAMVDSNWLPWKPSSLTFSCFEGLFVTKMEYFVIANFDARCNWCYCKEAFVKETFRILMLPWQQGAFVIARCLSWINYILKRINDEAISKILDTDMNLHLEIRQVMQMCILYWRLPW